MLELVEEVLLPEQNAALTLKPVLVLQPGPPKAPIRPSLEPQVAVPMLQVGVPLAQDIFPVASQVGEFASPNVGVKLCKTKDCNINNRIAIDLIKLFNRLEDFIFY